MGQSFLAIPVVQHEPPNFAEQIFNWLIEVTDTQNERVLFLFGFIAILMIFDLFTGILAGLFSKNRDFTSKTGINGLLRTIATLGALILVIPMSILVPGKDLGNWLIQAIYIAYIIFEWLSIIENLKDLGVNVRPLQKMVKWFKSVSDDKVKEFLDENKEEDK